MYNIDAGNLTISKYINSFTINSDSVCPITIIADVIGILRKLGIYIALVIFFFGIFLLYFGAKFIYVTIFFLSILFSFLFFQGLLYGVFKIESSDLISYFFSFLSIIIGICVGYVIWKYKRVLLSFLLGIINGLILCGIVFLVLLNFLNLPTVNFFYFFYFFIFFLDSKYYYLFNFVLLCDISYL